MFIIKIEIIEYGDNQKESFNLYYTNLKKLNEYGANYSSMYI